MENMSWRGFAGTLFMAFAAACSDASSGPSEAGGQSTTVSAGKSASTPITTGGASGAGLQPNVSSAGTGAAAAAAANGGTAGSTSQPTTTAPAGSGAAAMTPTGMTPTVGVAGMRAAAGTPAGTPTAGSPAGSTAVSKYPAGTPPVPTGPEDGQAGMPVISIPDVACGGPKGAFGSGLANFKIDDRDMIVTYPCDKHAGAPATFILNLHGTTPVAQHFYQHGYFSVHQFAASHNFIVVTPSSVVEQWGNMDNGQDEPHLMKIIDWVYANLNGAGKFDIKSMWVGGHSWGGLFTARFGCKAELADKVKGLIMMSGGGVSSSFGGAACASKLAVIISTAEGDKAMPGDQSTLAGTHGCGSAQSEIILNNVHDFWPMCMPGFVHANYYMLGKMHATSMDKQVVESIANWIKLQRQ